MRFDRVVEVPLPTAADRLEILRIHAARAPLAEDVSLERIAHDLRVAPASIQRELSGQGLTYKEAVEVTRQSLARMYLDQHQLPLTEIALLLGYSELSAFTRAFTRWTGASPRAYRKQGH